MVDASTIVEHLVGPTRDSALALLIESNPARLCAPHLCDAEVLSAFRRLTANGTLTPAASTTRLRLFRRLPLHRFSHRALLDQAFEYRDNFSAYDALYVALAERLGAPLMTCDLRLRDAMRRFSPVQPFDPRE